MAVPRVRIEVSGVRSDRGQVIVGLFREAGFHRFGGEPVIRKATAARPGSVELVFEAIEAARWAAAAYHDANGNGRLDLTMVGTPSEGRGYSRVDRPTLRPPTFAEACFEVADRDLELAIPLKYPG